MSEDRPTVLIVDDNPQILDSTASYLRTKGLTVITSNSPFGVGALVLRHKPKVVVLDMMMPALDGKSLAKVLQSQSATQNVPIIFFSAMEEEQLYRLTKQTANASYVLKSDGLPALHEAILSRLNVK